MLPDEYVQLALRTESNAGKLMVEGHHQLPRLWHAGAGMATEAGEFVDNLKKGTFCGKEFDYHNLAEEIGDMMWYVAVAVDALNEVMPNGITLEQIMRANIEKLRTRYPEKFTVEAGLNRDLDAERRTLEEHQS